MGALLVRLGDVEVGVFECFEDESQRFTFCEKYSSALVNSRPVLGQIFEDRFPHPIGSQKYTRELFGLTPEKITSKILERINENISSYTC